MSKVTSTSAYTEMVSQALPRLYGMARRMAGTDAEDLVQETLLRAFRRFDQLVATIGAIQQDPSQAKMTFRTGVEWLEGTHAVARIGAFTHAGAEDPSRLSSGFEIKGDEPPVLLGRNLGPNAVELCLAALGFCYAVGYLSLIHISEPTRPY